MDEAFGNAIGGGVTTAVTGPGSANVLGGSFVAMKLYGDCIDDMILKYPAAMKCAFGENPKGAYGQNGRKAPVTRMAVAAQLREMLFKAQRYAKEVEAAEKDETKTRRLICSWKRCSRSSAGRFRSRRTRTARTIF